MSELAGSFRMITNANLLGYILKGLVFTLVISLISIAVGLVLGTLLALARNYLNRGPARILKWICVGYIELFRNTPLMLWLFICLVFCPAPGFSYSMAQALQLSRPELQLLFKATVAMVLFTSSVLAEIIRGGFNSVSRGNFEAGYAQGFTLPQVLWLIVLPQAFRNIIPTLLSQVITTVKDTSYISNIATVELLGRVYSMIQQAPLYTGFSTINTSDIFSLCGLACVIYFTVNFSLSCLVRRLQTKGLSASVRKARETV